MNNKCIPAMSEQLENIEQLENAIKENLSAWRPSTNLIEIIVGKADDENTYSNILAWLLNPRGSHGLGLYYLRQFLTYAKKEAQKENFSYRYDGKKWVGAELPAFTKNLRISREESTDNRKRTDILCVDERKKFVLCIENKVNSKEGKSQLQSYREYLQQKYKDYTVVAIYLKQRQTENDSPDECKKGESPWQMVSYGPVAMSLQDALKSDEMTETHSSLITSFLQSIIRTLMPISVPDHDGLVKLGLEMRNKLISACQAIRERDKTGIIKRTNRKWTSTLVECFGFRYDPKWGRKEEFWGTNFHPCDSVFRTILGENAKWAYQLEKLNDATLGTAIHLKLTILNAKQQATKTARLLKALSGQKDRMQCAGTWPRLNDDTKHKKEITEALIIEQDWQDCVVWQSKPVAMTLEGFYAVLQEAQKVEQIMKDSMNAAVSFTAPQKLPAVKDDVYEFAGAYGFELALIKNFSRKHKLTDKHRLREEE